MRNLVLSCFLFLSFIQTKAQFKDSSSPKHLVAGVAIGAVGGYAANKVFDGNMRWTWAGAVGSALAAGLVKESLDHAEYGGWDNSDILYTTIGGVISGLALELLLNNNRRRGRGRPCSCYASNYRLPSSFYDTTINVVDTGSHSLTANIQAQYFLSK